MRVALMFSREIEDDFSTFEAKVRSRRASLQDAEKEAALCPICNQTELKGDKQNVCVDCEKYVCLDCGMYDHNVTTKVGILDFFLRGFFFPLQISGANH